MSKHYILAFDQGTTSSRTIVWDSKGQAVASAQQEFRQIYPQPGWVEHDATEIWETQRKTAIDALAKAGIGADEVAAIGITNQRETVVVWDRETGQPIHNAIVWQCRRTADICDALKEAGHEDTIRSKSGLVVDAYFSGTKTAWILDNVEGARDRAEAGELAMGTIDSWLTYNLTGEHVTDPSNACRTMLFNIHTMDWDDELLEIIQVPRAMLPRVVPTSGVCGETTLLGDSIPVAALCGDQQSALFGQTAFKPGMCKNTYGTGCFLVTNTGEEAVASTQGLLTSVAWQMDGTTTYMLEGSVFIGGAVIQWLRDEMKMIANAEESEAVAREVDDTGGVYLVPAFVGLGAPHWNQHARGTITGLTRGSGRAHIVRAALESIALQSADVVRAMEADMDGAIAELRVDGGAAMNDLLMQMQADVLGTPVARGAILESTALGAAYLAGLAVGLWPSTEALEGLWETGHRFDPQWDNDARAAKVNSWQNAVNTTIYAGKPSKNN